MNLAAAEKAKKLAALVESEGYESLDKLLEAAVSDSIAPGICIAPGCNYTTDSIEPDQRRGYCEACGGQTVQSALILADII